MSVSIRITVLAALLAAVPVAAQESGGGLIEQILKSARLPTVAREARVLGVPEQNLRTIFSTGCEERVSIGVLTDLISEGNHMTSEAFEALMLEIAQDPELTEAYEAARTGS